MARPCLTQRPIYKTFDVMSITLSLHIHLQHNVAVAMQTGRVELVGSCATEPLCNVELELLCTGCYSDEFIKEQKFPDFSSRQAW